MLDDVLIQGLDIVFVGMAAGNLSTREKKYYANSGNRFWKTLYEVGLTQRLYRPEEYLRLVELRFGFTDLCKTQAGMDHGITEIDIPAFEEKILKIRPRAVAFNGKRTGCKWLRQHSLSWFGYGIVPSSPPKLPTIFILPSTSGANGHWQIEPWRQLEQ